jgi:hypothetical protein
MLHHAMAFVVIIYDQYNLLEEKINQKVIDENQFLPSSNLSINSKSFS